MAADPRVTRLKEIRTRLAQGQDTYRRAKEQVGSDGWGKKREAVFTRLTDLIMVFQPGESGDKAVFVLGQCQGVLLDMGGPLLVIAEHEALREQAAKLEGALKAEEPTKS